MGRKSWAIVVFAAVAALTLLRLFLGADITDEANYSAHALTFLKEGRMFRSDLFIHGSAGVLLSPVVWVYTQVVGFDGVVLFLRFIYLAWVGWASWECYLFLRRFYRADWALAASSFYLAFIPFSIGSWSYNTVPAFGLPLAIFLLLSGSAIKVAAAGVVAAICCISYPPAALVVAAMLSWIWILRPRSVRLVAKVAFSLFILVGGLISLWMILRSADGIPRMLEFTKEFAWAGGFAKLKPIGDLFHRGALQSGLDFLVVAALILYFRGKTDWLAKQDFWLLGGALVLPIFWPITPQRTLSWLIYAPFFVLTFTWLGRFGTSRVSGHDEHLRPALFAGFLTAAVFGYTSSNILVNAGLGMVLPLQILLLNALHGLEARGRARAGQSLALISAVAALLVFGNYQFIYRDEPVWRLTSRVERGPYKNIFTNESRATLLAELDRDLEEASRGRGSIFASYLTPAYLSTNLQPVTGMLFLFEHQWSERAMRLILYRTLEQNEWPDLVVTRRIDEVEFRYQFEDFFIQSGRYDLWLERPNYRILARKPN